MNFEDFDYFLSDMKRERPEETYLSYSPVLDQVVLYTDDSDMTRIVESITIDFESKLNDDVNDTKFPRIDSLVTVYTLCGEVILLDMKQIIQKISMYEKAPSRKISPRNRGV